MNLQRCFLWSAEIQMIFIDHNHRYLGKEYVVVRSCVFAFVIRRFNIYCVLRGNESEQYQYYIDHFLKDKQYLNDLFSLYPVLERRINEIIQNAIDIYKEVIERIEKDADVLMKKFNITEKGFVVNHLSTDFSDSHKKGRRVFCVEFVSGDKILYKPRSLQNEIKLQEITNYFYRMQVSAYAMETWEIY